MGATGNQHGQVSGEASARRRAAAGLVAPSSGPAALPAAEQVSVHTRPAAWRESNLTILTRIHAAHPECKVYEVDRGWVAERGQGETLETVLAASPAGLEAKLDGLW